MELNPDIGSASEPFSALWAIDPHELSIRPSAGSLAEMKHLLGDSFTQLHPIYICGDESKILEEAKLQMHKFLQTLNLGHTGQPEVYRASSSKRTEWVQKVLSLAHDEQDKIILVTSHGRSLVGTLFLGSFAKEILQRSDIPILFLSSRPFTQKSGHKVLFATDLSQSSKAAFLRFLDFVKGKTSEVILCHIVKLPLSPSVEKVAKIEKLMSLPDYFVEYQKEWARVEIEEFLAKLGQNNFKFKLISIVEESRDTIAHAIEEVVHREGVKLVGVASHDRSSEKFRWGSVALELLPKQDFNLWVCGPKCLGEKYGF